MLRPMGTQPGVLGPASARWNDYVGTAAADDAAVLLNRPSLYELAEIDRDKWMILSVDVTRTAEGTTVTVYAIDKIAHHIVKDSDLDDLGDAAGELPVSPFVLRSESADQFLDEAFTSISIRLVARDAQGHRLISA
jgi:hypothetical protein